MAAFGNLYDHQTKNGIIIPQTSSVKATIEQAFKDIFGADMSIEAETPMGRLVEAMTLLFVDVLGVNAQNANSLNPEVAAGAFLDSLGKLWGIDRFEEEADSDYRRRILESQSRGNGYAESIRAAISQVTGTNACVVLNNPHKDVAILPNTKNGIPVEGHSVYICADCEDTDAAKEAVAHAIYSAISAGCGYTDNGFGSKVSVDIEDTAGATTTVVFFRPIQKNVEIHANVRSGSYTGLDIIADAKAAIEAYVGKHKMNTTMTRGELITAIAADNSGIVCTDLYFKIGSTTLSEVVLRPNEVLNITTNDVTIG